MAAWWSSSLTLAVLLYLTHAAPSPLGSRHHPPSSRVSSLTHSIQFTSSVRHSVQRLLVKYNEQLLGNKHHVDKRLVLESLPDVSMKSSTWRQMKAAERLCWDADGLRTFSLHMEDVAGLLQCKTDSTDRSRTTTLRAGTTTLRAGATTPLRRRRSRRAHSICNLCHSVQTGLRDLLKHVNAQLAHLNSSGSVEQGGVAPCGARAAPVPMKVTPSASSPVAMTSPPRSPRSPWIRTQNGYVVLRDLERFLIRLGFDFIYLKTKLPAQ